MLKKLRISPKILNASLCFALISAMVFSLADFDAKCDDLRQNILRLHIIANSDEDEDQEIKLKIRDAILEESSEIFLNTTDLQEAKNVAESQIEQFEEVANKVLYENGFLYKAEVSLGKADFETRVYDDFTLPAGVYDSLIITLGKGEGKNWWCVIFPEICLPTAIKGDLEDTVNKESAKVAKSPKKYKAGFKIVEIYHKIKKLIK